MRAILKNYSEDLHKAILTFEINLRDMPRLPEGDLDLTIKKWKSPRSREALNYSWQLITEIAEKLSVETPIGKDEVYKRMVNDHGVLERDEDNQLMKIVLKAEVDPMKVDLYLHETAHTTELDGTKYRLYYLVKPPHEYNSREFAQFLDHIVRRARELDIETLTPDEIRRMKC